MSRKEIAEYVANTVELWRTVFPYSLDLADILRGRISKREEECADLHEADVGEECGK